MLVNAELFILVWFDSNYRTLYTEV